jgi:hypothetical protein
MTSWRNAMKEIAEHVVQGMVLMGTPYRVAADLLPFESHTQDGVNVHAILAGGMLLISEALRQKLEAPPRTT